MNRPHVMHIIVQGNDRKLPWDLEKAASRVSILKARTPAEAGALIRAYPPVMLLADLQVWDAEARQCVEQVRAQIDPAAASPFIGVLRFEPDAAQRNELLEAGLDGLILESDPERLLLWQLDLLVNLRELSRFEQSKMDVNELSRQTRVKLHDLSQPLSAVQGRLQLLAAKVQDDNPDAKAIRDLVRLIFEVSGQLMEIQRIHRSYS